MINLRNEIATELNSKRKEYLYAAKESKNKDFLLERVYAGMAEGVFSSKLTVLDVLDETFNNLSAEQKQTLKDCGITLK